MLDRVFGASSLFAADKLRKAAAEGTPVNMEALFSQVGPGRKREGGGLQRFVRGAPGGREVCRVCV